MIILLLLALFVPKDEGNNPKETSSYHSMKNDCDAVNSNDYPRLRDVDLRNNYGYFNNRELCDSMAQVIMNDKSSDQLQFSRKHAAISLLLCHVDQSASDLVIDALIQNIQYRDPGAPPTARNQLYPCITCLLKIGRKAANKILQIVADFDDDNNNTSLARWFLSYYGQEDGIYVINSFLRKYSPALTKVQRTRIEKFIEVKMGGVVSK